MIPIQKKLSCLVLSSLLAASSSYAGAENTPRELAAPGFTFAAGTDGFKVEKIAGAAEADNIYSMTLDADGRVVVSGPGYIRRLIDTDGDGYLETRQEVYAGPEKGSQGLLVVEDALFFVGGAGLQRLSLGPDGAAQGEPTLVLPCATGGEHNTHAVRRGPDGFLYLLGGNFMGLDLKSTRNGFSAIRDPYAGLFLRLSPDGVAVEVLAHGMRNAYDFDFLPDGEVVAWDSDGERDEGLPWYRPTGLYHLTPGADCGWRTSGSGKVPTYAFDTPPPVAQAGRGCPTGVVCYRHRGEAGSFPARYQGGVFALDWTFGRVLFFSLTPRDGSYDSQTEVFLQASSVAPFAPTDVEVAPDGSLLISSGGRGLDGAVFRVAYRNVDASAADAETRGQPASIPEKVFGAPMPQAAWSRKRWWPLATLLPPERLRTALASSDLPDEERVRALDVLLEAHPSIYHQTMQVVHDGGLDIPAAVRARAAWWAERYTEISDVKHFLGDQDPRVLRVAVESSMRFLGVCSDRYNTELARTVLGAAANPARRVQQAVAFALAHFDGHEELAAVTTSEETALRVAGVLRTPWGGRLPLDVGDTYLSDAMAGGTASRLDALRLIEISFERLRSGHDPRASMYEHWGEVDLEAHAGARSFVQLLLGAVPREADPRVTREMARLGGLLRLEAMAPRMAARLTKDSHPGEDLLSLSFLAQLREPWEDATRRRVADAVVGIPYKVARQEIGRDARWHRYMATAWEGLTAHHPQLVRDVIEHERFGHPDHTTLASPLEGDLLHAAIARYCEEPLPEELAARKRVVSFLAAHPVPRAREVLHRVASDEALRPLVLDGLAQAPEERDRDMFLHALTLERRDLVAPATRGLLRLSPPDDDGRHIEAFTLIAWGFRLDQDPALRDTRDLVARQLGRLLGGDTGYQEKTDSSQRAAFLKWSARLEEADQAFTESIAALMEDLDRPAKILAELMEGGDWTRGSARSGRDVFQKRGCEGCHRVGDRGQRLGPDLTGIGTRFPPKKILEAVAFPDREVPPRYRTELFVLTTGETLEGITVYDSRAATLLRTRDGRLHRIAAASIATHEARSSSFMPSGLLDGLSSAKIVDLVTFLRDSG